ncbi:hypothetical protein DXT66_13785 [Nocardia farcinica]|nr:hypothetical protein DXT66_13785 [Nocardia farcinica]
MGHDNDDSVTITTVVYEGGKITVPHAYAVHDVADGVLILYPDRPTDTALLNFNFDKVITWATYSVSPEIAAQRPGGAKA